MIKIIKELNIEVTKPNVFQAIVAKQYDMNTRFLKVTLVDDGNKISVPQTDTTMVVINAERIDGQAKGFDGEVNEDGTVTVPLHSWMLELDGAVMCDISVVNTKTDNEQKLTTTSFTLIVEKAAYGGDDVTTDPQYDVLIDLITQVENLLATAGDDKQDKFAEATERDGKLTLIAGRELTLEGFDSTKDFSGYLSLLYGMAELGAYGTVTVKSGTDDVKLSGRKAEDDSANINADGCRIRNLAEPIFDRDAVNKAYLDGAVGDIEAAIDAVIALQENLIGGGV